MKALVALGADVNILNSSNQTALDSALMVKKSDVAKFLEDVGGAKGSTLGMMNLPQCKEERQQQVMDDGDDQMREEVGVGGKLPGTNGVGGVGSMGVERDRNVRRRCMGGHEKES